MSTGILESKLRKSLPSVCMGRGEILSRLEVGEEAMLRPREEYFLSEHEGLRQEQQDQSA